MGIVRREPGSNLADDGARRRTGGTFQELPEVRMQRSRIYIGGEPEKIDGKIRLVGLTSKLLDVLVLHRVGYREDQRFFRTRLRREAHLSKDPAKAPDSVSREDR